MPDRNSFFDYVKAAFLWHWNLLALGAGAALAFLSGRPDMLLPLVAAGEIAYLGLLSTHPRFRKSVDARTIGVEAEQKRSVQLAKIMESLTKKDIQRFNSLRNRCATLDKLGKQFHGKEAGEKDKLDDIHYASLERLLWMFLKLLYSRDALDNFLRNTNRNELTAEIKETEADLAKAREENRMDSLIRALDDKLITMRERLNNYDSASDNRDLIVAELERIEQKVTAVSEMSFSSGDPSTFSSQVDGIAAGMSVAAEAIRSLDLVPELDDEAPDLLNIEEV